MRRHAPLPASTEDTIILPLDTRMRDNRIVVEPPPYVEYYASRLAGDAAYPPYGRSGEVASAPAPAPAPAAGTTTTVTTPRPPVYELVLQNVVCEDSARIELPGRQEVGLTAAECEAFCNAYPACTHYAALSDVSCRIYTHCDAPFSVGVPSQDFTLSEVYRLVGAFERVVPDFDDFAPGEYELCYCSSFADKDLMPTANFSSYMFADDVRCNTSYYIPRFELEEPWGGHVCTTKCPAGCSGPDCHCELAIDDAVRDFRLCLPAEECRRACEAHPQCDGFDIIGSGCILTTGCAGWQEPELLAKRFDRVAGETCTHPHDFAFKAADLVLTDRTVADAHYVVAPGDAVVEVQVRRGTYNDRIAILDSFATCGLNAPTAHVDVDWRALHPDTGVSEHPPPPPHVVTMASFKNLTGDYCVRNNLIPSEYGLEKHQCFNKCSRGSESPDYNEEDCRGYYSGYDTATTNALCLSKEMCMEVCSDIRDCIVIDMHREIPRCFLNPGICVESESLTGKSDNYEVLVRETNIMEQRRLAHSASDLWVESLPFGPIPLPAGTFQVCFCDAEKSACGSWADFNVLAGTLHVSSVSCLLSVPKLRSADCSETPLCRGLVCVAAE